jgi:hypothetical protein
MAAKVKIIQEAYMHKGVILVLVSIFVCISVAFAEDSLVITTYYPSPYGSYNEIRANRMVIGSFTTVSPSDGAVTFNPTTNPTGAEGTLYYDSTAHGFKYRDNSGWKGIGEGYWTANESNIYNTNAGNVGVGTKKPTSRIQVENDSYVWAGAQRQRFSTSLTGAGLFFNDSTGTSLLLIGTPVGSDDHFGIVMNGIVPLEIPGSGPDYLKVKIMTSLDVNGTIYQRGGILHVDYVFEPDYKLESIEEHAQYMWKYKHLKAVPKAKVDEKGQQVVEIGANTKGILEELEKAHIYIQQLNERIKALESYENFRGTKDS